MATNNAVNTGLAGQSGSGNFVGNNQPAITSPQIITLIKDANGNTILNLSPTGSAVNYITLINQSTTNAPGFSSGSLSDTNVDFGMQTQGTGNFRLRTENLTTPLILINGTSGQHTTNFIFANTSATRSVTFPDATGTLLMTGVAISTVPSIAFSSTSGVIGTTTNDNAAAGSVGEFVSSTVSAPGVALTSAIDTNFTSISLTAGDWDVWGNTFYTNTSSANTLQQSWISSTSATPPDASFITQLSNAANVTSSGFSVAARRFSLSGTTTIYLSGRANYTGGGVSVSGGIYARRRR